MDAALGQKLDPVAFESRKGRFGELRWHRSQHSVAGVHQHDPCFLGIQLFEGIVQGPTHQLRNGTSHLAAAGAGTNDHHRLQKLACLGVRCLLRLLHRHQQTAAYFLGVFEDFHRGRKGTPVFVAEISAA